MISKLLAIIAIALLSAPLSNALADEPSQWFLDAIKVDNPNELAIGVFIGENCPITEVEMKEIVSGVLIRSRIKPLAEYEWVIKSLYLGSHLVCVNDPNSRHIIYVVNIFYGNAANKPAIRFEDGYGFTGLGAKQDMVRNVKMITEDAITDFIKANFDL